MGIEELFSHSKFSISTRRWPHDDEYTSITDAIQIVDLDTQEPKAVSVSSIFAHAGGSSSIVYDEENRSKLLDILPHLKEQTTIDTETEEVGVEHTDEENDVENDDNDEEEFDEDDNVLYGRDYGGDGTWYHRKMHKLSMHGVYIIFYC